MSRERFAEFAAIRTWAMDVHHLRAWARVVNEAGLDFGEKRAIAAETQAAAKRGPRAASGGEILVIPLVGAMSQRGGMSTQGTEAFAEAVKVGLADPAVSGIVIEADSPGGEVYGVDEAATIVRQGKLQKPIVAAVNSLAASAAYYAVSGATEIIVTPSGEAGSIGVYGVHEDWSQAVDQAGVKVTFVSAGEGKTDGNPYQPLSEEALADMQGQVDRYYQMFTTAVAKGRGVSVDVVRGDWKAKVYGAKQAVEMGMATSVGTLEDAIRRAASLGRQARATQASVVTESESRMRLRERA